MRLLSLLFVSYMSERVSPVVYELPTILEHPSQLWILVG